MSKDASNGITKSNRLSVFAPRRQTYLHGRRNSKSDDGDTDGQRSDDDDDDDADDDDDGDFEFPMQHFAEQILFL